MGQVSGTLWQTNLMLLKHVSSIKQTIDYYFNRIGDISLGNKIKHVSSIIHFIRHIVSLQVYIVVATSWTCSTTTIYINTNYRFTNIPITFLQFLSMLLPEYASFFQISYLQPWFSNLGPWYSKERDRMCHLVNIFGYWFIRSVEECNLVFLRLCSGIVFVKMFW